MSLRLSNIAHKIPDFYVLKIDKLANQLIKEGKDIIKLNLGKSEVPMGKSIAREFSEKINDEKCREIIDSQGLLLLREAIAEDYKTVEGVTISPDQIFINNGTSPFFLQLYFLLLDPGDEILFPLPYYPPYVASAHIRGAQASFYPIHDGKIDFGEFKERFVPGKTKVVFLNSPGNPFGNVIKKEELKEIFDFVDGRAHIISDEIYDGFVYGEDTFASALSVYVPERDSVIILNGFSKIHHMYTRRLGYAIVPEALIGPMLKFQQHNIVCVDPVTQFAGIRSMKNKQDFMATEIKKEVAEYKERLDACEELFKRTKLRFIRPEGSFYMCVDVGAYISDAIPGSLALAERLLADVGVAVTPGEDFGRNDFFRISLTNDKVVNGVQKMCDFFNQLK